jgi:hypothetical protein
MDKDLLAAVQSIAQSLKPQPHLTQTLAPYIALVLSMVAIVMQLYILNKNAKLNLFQHRMKVYTALHKFVESIIFHTDATDKALQEFHSEILPAKFLFHPNVLQHLKEVEWEARQLHADIQRSKENKAMIAEMQNESKTITQAVRDAISESEESIRRIRVRLYQVIEAESDPLFAPQLKMRRGKIKSPIYTTITE